MEALFVYHLIIAFVGGGLAVSLIVWLTYLYVMLREKNYSSHVRDNHSTKENGLS